MNEDFYFENILPTNIKIPVPWRTGKSRAGKLLPAFRFGAGPVRVSLIAGCHADEPTGPRLLRKLVTWLDQLPSGHSLLREFSWLIVPHVNPDGEALNRRWYTDADEIFDLAKYLRYRVRELPGDDLEYGFPVAGKAPALRPENQFVYDCWREIGQPFHLHASLHGMGWSFGAWFLIDAAWRERSDLIQRQCRRCAVELLGYPLFDIDRKGEKGFFRISQGFCTRPDSEGMKRHFIRLGDPEMAAKFHPSSMESVRSLGGDCLTLVSEMPLFILPQKKKDLQWPNPEFESWNDRMRTWTMRLETGAFSDEEVRQEARKLGIAAMPAADQMRLQWSLVSAGIARVLK